MSVDEVKPTEEEAADENAVAPRGTHLASTQTITHEYLTQSGKVMRETVTTNQTVTAVMDFVYSVVFCGDANRRLLQCVVSPRSGCRGLLQQN